MYIYIYIYIYEVHSAHLPGAAGRSRHPRGQETARRKSKPQS